MKKDINLNPNEIESIFCLRSFQDEADKDCYVYCYQINGKGEYISIVNYKDGKRVIGNDVYSDRGSFVNGYKVVETAPSEYAYIREKDNALLPGRFDVATNFNEYGLAMVAKDGRATWINENLDMLTMDRGMVPYEEVVNTCKFGFQGVNAFSKGEKPLARVIDRSVKVIGEEGRNVAFGFAYIKPNTEFKEFFKYNGENLSSRSKVNFEYGCGSDFDERGYAVGNSYVFFDRGAYIPVEEFRNVCRQDALLGLINGVVNDVYDKSLENNNIRKKSYSLKYARK